MTREEAKELVKEAYGNNEFTDEIIKALEQEPCEDCVSKEQAIKSLNCKISGSIESNIDLSKYRREFQEFANMIIDAQEKALRELPPVTPTRKKGKWIYNKDIQNWECSECGETPKTLGFVGTSAFMTEHFKFCNHCGAEMEKAESEA